MRQCLKEKVEEAVALDDRVEADRVAVVMRGTTAYLQGEVASAEQYAAAEEAANGVSGVTAVVNELVVTGEAIDLGATALGVDLRAKPSPDVLEPGGLSESRVGPFGVDADEATSIEGETMGGPVGGDIGGPQRPESAELTAPLGAESVVYTMGSRLCPYCGTDLDWSVDMLDCPECNAELNPSREATEDRTEEYEGEDVLPVPRE